MAQEQFMLQDLQGILAAAVLFPLFLLIPGYVLGWATNLLQFRQRTLLTRTLLAIVLSISICPILTYLSARFFSFVLVLCLYAITWVAFVWLAAVGLRRQNLASWHARLRASRLCQVSLLIILIWAATSTLSLIDLQAGQQLYFSYTSYDYHKHMAMTNTLLRNGVPPANPYFAPGHPVELYYYYFWYLLCSLVPRLGGATTGPRAAVMAGTIWCGTALMALVTLWLRFLSPRPPHTSAAKRSIVGIGLLLVSGLDVIPSVGLSLLTLAASRGWLYADIEWWNEQITAWMGAVLWVPQHVAGLVACLTGLLLLRTAPSGTRWRERAVPAVLAALAFASALGLSMYVTLVGAAFLLAWMLLSLAKQWYDEVGLCVLAGASTLLLSARYLLDLQKANQLHSMVLGLTVRAFLPWQHLAGLLGVHSTSIRTAGNLLLLPLNYLLEFGFFAVAAALYWRGRRRAHERLDKADWASIVLWGVSLSICTFVRSTIKNNDLGWRAAMPAQFVTLIWAVPPTLDLLAGWRMTSTRRTITSGLGRRARSMLTLFLVIGLLTTMADLTLLRTFPMLSDLPGVGKPTWLGTDLALGRRTYAVRQAYQWVKSHLPEDTIVQHNPDVTIDVFRGLYGDRQVVASDWHHGIVFGISPAAYNLVASEVAQIFSGTVEPDRICQKYLISALVVKDTDPVWSDASSWVWKRKPAFANDRVMVFVLAETAAKVSRSDSR